MADVTIHDAHESVATTGLNTTIAWIGDATGPLEAQPVIFGIGSEDWRLNADVLGTLRTMGHGDVLIPADTEFPFTCTAHDTVLGERRFHGCFMPRKVAPET